MFFVLVFLGSELYKLFLLGKQLSFADTPFALFPLVIYERLKVVMSILLLTELWSCHHLVYYILLCQKTVNFFYYRVFAVAKYIINMYYHCLCAVIPDSSFFLYKSISHFYLFGYLFIYLSCMHGLIVVTYPCKLRERLFILNFCFLLCHKHFIRSSDYLLTVLPLLLLLAGDIHVNPGPVGDLCDITLCHINVRSLTNDKFRCIKTDIVPDFDIITLSETFLSNNTPDDDFNLPGYHNIIRKDRPNIVGGGVAKK